MWIAQTKQYNLLLKETYSNLAKSPMHRQGDQNTSIMTMEHKLRYLTMQPTAYLLQGRFNTLYENILSNNMIYFSAEVQLQLK